MIYLLVVTMAGAKMSRESFFPEMRSEDVTSWDQRSRGYYWPRARDGIFPTPYAGPGTMYHLPSQVYLSQDQ